MGGRGGVVGGEPVLLESLGDHVGVVVVAGQQGVVVEVVLGGHGQLGLQQHRVERRVTRAWSMTSLVGQELAQVLLVQAGVEQVGVRVAGRRLRGSHRDVGALTLRGYRRLSFWFVIAGPGFKRKLRFYSLSLKIQ